MRPLILLALLSACSSTGKDPFRPCSGDVTHKGRTARVCRHVGAFGVQFCCEWVESGERVGECSTSYDKANETCAEFLKTGEVES